MADRRSPPRASFRCDDDTAADTPVATPSGERPIARLAVGDHVLAYDPSTGKRSTQTVARVFLNQDHDRLDVTIALPQAALPDTRTAPAAAAALTPLTPLTRDAEAARARARLLASQGLRAPPDGSAAAVTPAPATTPAGMTEVIHTTAIHPWLTADRGWLVAGSLQVGEPVRLLGGGTAAVVALHALPGVGPMWDLSLDEVHTFAVGDAQAVVHNCGDPQKAFTELTEMRQGLGMGGAGTPSGGTLAKLEVGDQSFFGVNAHGQPVSLRVNPISETHAEADVFQQAANAGVNEGDGYLYVDRDLCGACGRSGAVRSMAKQIGLSSLTVFTPSVPGGVLWLLE